MTFNFANILTLFRIAAIPLFVLAFYLNAGAGREFAAILFGLAALTDWFDGYVARRFDQMTPFGEFLDPVADKLIVAVALVLLVQDDPSIMMAAVAAIIIGREITVSALREWMASVGDRTTVAVTFVAKVKTTMQMIGLGLLIWKADIGPLPTYDVGFVLLLSAAGLTMWSMWAYLRAAWPALSRLS